MKCSVSAQVVLYISYDGMLEPLGQSQVLAYLKKLAAGRKIYLLSFEKPEDLKNKTDLKNIKKEISDSGVNWYPLRYHRRPTAIATAWDITRGIFVGLWLVVINRVNIVHARSYVPSVISLVIKRLTGIKYIFDMRGFWADEKVDGGSWPRNGYLYKVAKGLERRFILAADHLVSLTHAGLREISLFNYVANRMPPTSVIPTCADLDRFTPSLEPVRFVKGDSFVLGYVGSVGTYYMFDKVIECFLILLTMQPNAKFLIINKYQHVYIRERLKIAGVSDDCIELTEARHSEIPGYMRRMNAGIFFIKPVFSKQASAPTKLAEFLGCGIPCLGNAGVGDMAEVLESRGIGCVVRSFDNESLTAGINKLVLLALSPTTSGRCASAAKKYFSLDDGVERYKKIYERLESI